MSQNPLFTYKEYVIGIITIIISVGGSWETSNEKNADRDKQVAVLTVEYQMLKSQADKQSAVQDQILNTVNRIDKTTTELKALKADRKFTN